MKLVTFPLTVQQTRGMQAQKDLQPKLQELQKKYGKDREKIAAEQMKLYQEAGVNPLSGCLPLVIQMPILFGLYAALVAVGPMLENAGFFWIPDLSYPQYHMGLSWIPKLWETGQYALLISYMILPILLVVTQLVMQKWMTPTPAGDDGQARMTQNMSLVMTLFFGYFTLAGSGWFDPLLGNQQLVADASAVVGDQVLYQETSARCGRRNGEHCCCSYRGFKR